MTIEGEDFLSVDTPIPGQNFACLSFVSPEKILKNKNIFLIHEFLKNAATDLKIPLDKITKDYDDYYYNNRDKLEKGFYEQNDFQTSVRGMKVRGVYDTKREADIRAKVLQRKDKNFHVFVGQVGYWLPWDPEADDIQEEEYAENELNKLVKKYNDNRKKKDIFYEQQKQDSIEKINDENASTKENLEKDSIFKNDSDPWIQRKIDDTDKQISQLLINVLDNNLIPHHGPWEDHKKKINSIITDTCDNADEHLKEHLDKKMKSIGWCSNPTDLFYDNLRKNLEIIENDVNNIELPDNVVDIDN